MTYVVDRPNIQLDAQDCLAIKNSLESVANGYPCDSANVQLDKFDLAALDAAIDGSAVAVNTANINLTAADITAIAPHVT